MSLLAPLADTMREAVRTRGLTAADLHRVLESAGVDVSLRTVERTCYRGEGAVEPPPRGTWLRGERSPNARLRREEVRAIRSRQGKEHPESVARRYGISEVHVRQIWRRARWAWLD